jgi:hypothetical protein
MPDTALANVRNSARVARNELMTLSKELADAQKRVNVALGLVDRILREGR